VDPAFIKTAGIAQSLTPGRNNGFLNMLALMKKKALEANNSSQKTTASSSSSSSSDTDDTKASSSSDRPMMYDAMISKLQALLKPTLLELKDNSHEHAGHAGNKGNGQESHFQLSIVAEAFDGLNLVKRHKLIYMILGDLMPQIHALQIQAMTPAEADRK
jgi:BolA-like protein 1